MIIIISSPSGAGKTSICKKLLKLDNSIKISISDTTRIPRDNEVDGKDYNFISESNFKSKISNNEYAEYAKVFENYYGSLHSNVLDLIDNGFDVLFDIDWQGAQQLKKSNYNNILSFFIMPPSRDVIYNRLLSRAKISGDDELAINKRMSFFDTEISHKDEYDHVLINEDLDICTNQIYDIIRNSRKIKDN
tara:strand:- start:52 stop:624 length:573 start_codon:yes stop_codon:yes gene_type:complete